MMEIADAVATDIIEMGITDKKYKKKLLGNTKKMANTSSFEPPV